MSAPEAQKKGEEEELKTEQEVLGKYNAMRQEQQSLMTRITQVENESHEHNLVLETLKPLDDKRKCHRQIGGILVGKTVGEVRPEVEDSLAHFTQLLKNLNDTLNEKSKEMEAFVAKYKIRPVSERERQQMAQDHAQTKEAGVLA